MDPFFYACLHDFTLFILIIKSTNDPHHYIVLAKEWLEDDDVQRRGSEKLCAYLYSIVLGKDDDD